MSTDHLWKAGERVPGSGRPLGARNRRTAEITTKINERINRGDGVDPLERLHELTKSKDEAIAETQSFLSGRLYTSHAS